jgi:hypothetical protein
MKSRTDAIAVVETSGESVRMYVMRPTGPSSPTSLPSYRSCAARIVRRDEKPSFLAASCCRVLVVNGAAGFFLRLRFSTLETMKGLGRTASTTARASASVCS